jgi:hypothetical protein
VRIVFRGHASGVAGALACVLASACGEVAAPTPSSPAHLSVVAGDKQTGTGGTPLASPIVFAVTDGEGRPLAGVTVALAVAAGGGTIPGQAAITGGDGTVATGWTLGNGEGPQALEARVPGVPSVRATAWAAGCAPPECPPSPPYGVLELLALQTYDQSGQVVHPDVATAAELGGHPFWLGITPYPGGDAAYENPSIFQSLDGRAWKVPEGLSNPVVRPGAGYLSDPDVLFEAANQRLWMYYRQVVGARNVIHLSRSGDGVHWSAPQEVVSAPSHELVSPAVVHGAAGAAWTMWSVNSGPAGCSAARTVVERRTSEDGERWGPAQTTDLAQPGQVVWHIDVQWIPARSEYWALYNTFPTGGTCTTDALHLARSPDGVQWTSYPSAVLRTGAIEAFRHIVYRSTFAVDPRGERVTFWFSGANYEGGRYVWRAATESRRTADLLAGLEQPERAILSTRIHLPPPEPADMPVAP